MNKRTNHNDRPFTAESFRPFTDSFCETGNQVHQWVMRKAQECSAAENERKTRMKNLHDVETYRAGKRRRFIESIGGLPGERCALKTRETGRIVRDGYSISKLIYQSLPSFYVTANLYVPEGLETSVPGVLMGCGHSKDGKAAPMYQKVCISLVRAGFVVLIIDSPSHGEMLQCVAPATGEPLAGWNTREHSHLQLSASVLGQNIMRYFLWNAMRGLDLLCERPEVDPERIGMTGNSGGGHLTQAMMMADDRVKVAMPGCSLTTRENYLKTGIRAYDGEQNYFACIPQGLDYDDFLSCFAPRPLRVGAAEYDYFAIEGVLEAVERARHIYRLCGVENHLDLCIAKGERHGYSAPLRRGCVEWFTRHLHGHPFEAPDDDPEVESPETLQCTRTGRVLTEYPGARSMIDLNREAWQNIRCPNGEAPPSRAELIRRLDLQLDASATIRPRCTSRNETQYGTVERVFFFSEPDIAVTAVLYRPRPTPSGAALMLVPDGTEGQQPYAQTIASLVEEGRVVMVFDPRGTGAVRMRRRNHGDGYAFRSTEFRVAKDHFMLGTSIASRRSFDILMALRFLRSYCDLPAGTSISLMADGPPAIWGLLAAAADGGLAGCSLSGLAGSWTEAFQPQPPDSERLSEPLIAPELKGVFDIPDLLRLAAEGQKSQE